MLRIHPQLPMPLPKKSTRDNLVIDLPTRTKQVRSKLVIADNQFGLKPLHLRYLGDANGQPSGQTIVTGS